MRSEEQEAPSGSGLRSLYPPSLLALGSLPWTLHLSPLLFLLVPLGLTLRVGGFQVGPKIPFLSQGQVPGALVLVSFPAQSARPAAHFLSLPHSQGHNEAAQKSRESLQQVLVGASGVAERKLGPAWGFRTPSPLHFLWSAWSRPPTLGSGLALPLRLCVCGGGV